MEMNQYQFEAGSTAIYRERRLGPIIYPLLKLSGETGETLEKFGKLIRDEDWDGTLEGLTEDQINLIAKEIGDVLWYCAALATDIGFNLARIASMNLNKLADRKDRGVIGGSGDER